MNYKPEISVIMPVYNSEDYLSISIDSILKQSFKNFEFIIINDGSTDNSEKIILNYLKKDQRIIYIKNSKNNGISKSLNIGIKKSKGNFICRMDADDISHFKRLEIQKNFLLKNHQIGVCGSYIRVLFNKKYTKYKYPVNSDDCYAALLFSNPVPHPASMFKKKIISDNKLTYNNKNLYGCEDYEFWHKVSKFTNFSNIPSYLYVYRDLSDSLSKRGKKNFNRRFSFYSNVCKKFLISLKVKLTKYNVQVHYDLSDNQLLSKSTYSFIQFQRHLLNILLQNKKYKIFNHKSLKKIILKKILICFFFKFKFNNIFKLFTLNKIN
jgi:glycosyltransferase involved in cell wall biosynthesis